MNCMFLRKRSGKQIKRELSLSPFLAFYLVGSLFRVSGVPDIVGYNISMLGLISSSCLINSSCLTGEI